MFKKNGGRIVAALAILLVGGLLLTGTVPAFAAGNGVGNGKEMGRNGNSLVGIVSDVLELSRADLASERQAGKSLLDIAAEKGFDKDQLVESVLAKRQANLEQALKDNKISEEQYNQCVQEMEENIEKNLSRTEVGPNGNGKGNSNANANANGKGQGLRNGPGQGKGTASCNGSGNGCGVYCQR